MGALRTLSLRSAVKIMRVVVQNNQQVAQILSTGCFHYVARSYDTVTITAFIYCSLGLKPTKNLNNAVMGIVRDRWLGADGEIRQCSEAGKRQQ